MRYIKLLVRATRPKQWIKNLLVIVAPIAAGDLFNQFSEIFLGLIGFTSSSIIGYVVNDWLDQESDRAHHTKRSRPFASRQLKIPSLAILLLLNLTVTLATCLFLPKEFTFSVIAYVSITLSYSFIIKNKPVLEMLWLATGFLIRAIAGSAIIQKTPTGWFLVSVLFGAIFVVSAKRMAELKTSRNMQTRTVLIKYNESFLNLVLTSSVSITLLTYSLWVFEVHPESILAQLTIIPFALSVFLYSYHCENGDSESPENLIYKDKMILLSVMATILPLAMLIYL